MKCLSVGAVTEVDGCRAVRAMCFSDRSMLSAGAACVIASGVREALAAMLGKRVDLRLFEPALPAPAAWEAILRDAVVYRVTGALAEAAIVVRPPDARAFGAAAFGELEPAAAPISALERGALDRIVAALAAQFAAICGEGLRYELSADPGTYATYFELQIDEPFRARLGVALRRDPQPQPAGTLAFEQLLDVELTVGVRLDAGRDTAERLAALEPGVVLPFPPGPLRACVHAAGTVLAHGECGVRGQRYAFCADVLSSPQGSTVTP